MYKELSQLVKTLERVKVYTYIVTKKFSIVYHTYSYDNESDLVHDLNDNTFFFTRKLDRAHDDPLERKFHRIDGPACFNVHGNYYEWILQGECIEFEDWCLKTKKSEKEKVKLKLKYI